MIVPGKVEQGRYQRPTIFRSKGTRRRSQGLEANRNHRPSWTAALLRPRCHAWHLDTHSCRLSQLCQLVWLLGSAACVELATLACAGQSSKALFGKFEAGKTFSASKWPAPQCGSLLGCRQLGALFPHTAGFGERQKWRESVDKSRQLGSGVWLHDLKHVKQQHVKNQGQTAVPSSRPSPHYLR